MGPAKFAWLVLTAMATAPAGYAATILGPLNAVTGIDGLTFADGSQTYAFNVTFVAGSYNSVYGANVPTFQNNASAGLAAATAIAAALTSAGATSLGFSRSRCPPAPG